MGERRRKRWGEKRGTRAQETGHKTPESREVISDVYINENEKCTYARMNEHECETLHKHLNGRKEEGR